MVKIITEKKKKKKKKKMVKNIKKKKKHKISSRIAKFIRIFGICKFLKSDKSCKTDGV